MRQDITPLLSAPLPFSPLASALLACAVLLLPAWALASSSPMLSDQEQAALSTAVIVADVESSQLGVDERWGRAVARTSVRVVEVLDGQAPDDLVLEQFVGRQGQRVYRMPGDAKLTHGERCVLFIREVGGHWYLTAMELSKYSIVHTPTTPRIRRVMAGGIFGGPTADSRPSEEDPQPGTLRTLDELRHSLSSPRPPSHNARPQDPGESQSGLSSGGDA
ncbi:MAG: hypothetical protein CL928_15045 [Deltaproteobacteria bacterium]|nr:hypothetical protein [Deltaproteobacteria bacterium]